MQTWQIAFCFVKSIPGKRVFLKSVCRTMRDFRFFKEQAHFFKVPQFRCEPLRILVLSKSYFWNVKIHSCVNAVFEKAPYKLNSVG